MNQKTLTQQDIIKKRAKRLGVAAGAAAAAAGTTSALALDVTKLNAEIGKEKANVESAGLTILGVVLVVMVIGIMVSLFRRP